jgi:dihydrofolate reductase
MRKLVVSNMVTLDGFIGGPNDEIDWHLVDEDFNALANELPNQFDTQVYGRVTYELMASYWPTPAGAEDDAIIAAFMNSANKVVFSRTLETVDWQNSRLAKEGLADEVAALKQQPGKDIVIFGSGTIVAQLTPLGLIDEYRLFVCPVALGSGKSQFAGMESRANLKLIEAETFRSGVVYLNYERAADDAS